MAARDVLGNRRIAIFMSDLFLRNRAIAVAISNRRVQCAPLPEGRIAWLE